MGNFKYICPSCNHIQTKVIFGENLTGTSNFKKMNIVNSDFKKLCWYDFISEWIKCPNCKKILKDKVADKIWADLDNYI